MSKYDNLISITRNIEKEYIEPKTYYILISGMNSSYRKIIDKVRSKYYGSGTEAANDFHIIPVRETYGIIAVAKKKWITSNQLKEIIENDVVDGYRINKNAKGYDDPERDMLILQYPGENSRPDQNRGATNTMQALSICHIAKKKGRKYAEVKLNNMFEWEKMLQDHCIIIDMD